MLLFCLEVNIKVILNITTYNLFCHSLLCCNICGDACLTVYTQGVKFTPTSHQMVLLCVNWLGISLGSL